MPRARRRALTGLARALADGELILDAGADREQTARRLLALPGIGPWTAAYVAMRALRDPDAFLPTDLGVRHALEALGQDASPAAALRLGERWRPYRAYALQHLWAHAGSGSALRRAQKRTYSRSWPMPASSASRMPSVISWPRTSSSYRSRRSLVLARAARRPGRRVGSAEELEQTGVAELVQVGLGVGPPGVEGLAPAAVSR